MAGLPNELYKNCRSILLQCREFDSDSSLVAIFVTDKLFPFKNDLPGSSNKAERVDNCLAYLLSKHLSGHQPVLPVFLEVLRDRYPEEDALRDQLNKLVCDVSQALMAPISHSKSSPQDSEGGSSETITWLHLSDLHFRESRTFDTNIVLKALLKDVDERVKADALQPDFVVITGDLAFSGQPSEYTLARTFFDELLKTTNLSKNRLFVVPGNHDVNRNVITAGAKAIGGSLMSRDNVNTLIATPEDRQLIFSRFEGYKDFVNDYFSSQLSFNDERYFYVQNIEVNRQHIALLGMNSSWLAASDEDKALGLVLGERQVRAALDAAEQSKTHIKIALLHHPFDWLREFDQRDSAALLLDNCDFVLHGHLHQSALSQLSNPDSSAMMIAGGACYETRDYPNSYNFVQLDLGTGTGKVHLRRYSDLRGGFWAPDTLTYKNVSDGVFTFSLNPKTQMNFPLSKAPKSHTTENKTNTNIGNAAKPQSALRTLRQKLNQSFDDVEFDAFCLDHFPDVYDKFGRGMRKDEKITLLLDSCRRNPKNNQKLLAEIEE